MYDIEQYSRSIIDEMIYLKATDVHIVPSDDKYLFAYRINGELDNWKKLNATVADRLISHFKYQSGMDIGERRKPQSSSMIHRTQAATFSLRLSTLPTFDKESLAIRLLPHLSPQDFPSLSVLQQSQNTLVEISELSSGLCLLSGTTGSGKSTTLYAIVEQMIKKGGKTIITIEDPVERPISSIIQVEVNKKAGMTFDSILRASLRHDPDVLLIGEIRDETTARLAIRAAHTGHLVLATVHANSSYAALLRMLDLGVSQLDLTECCRFVLSQRLVRTKCPLCIGSCHPQCERLRHTSRAALFDVLTGEDLTTAISNSGQRKSHPYLDEIKMAWALGYLTDDETVRVRDD